MKILTGLVLLIIVGPIVLVVDGGAFFLAAFADAMERIKKEAGRD